MLAWAWEVWKAYAHRAGSYQTRVLLTVVYAVVLGPVAFIGRLTGSPLMDLSPSASETAWLVRGTPEKTLADLRRQF